MPELPLVPTSAQPPVFPDLFTDVMTWVRWHRHRSVLVKLVVLPATYHCDNVVGPLAMPPVVCADVVIGGTAAEGFREQHSVCPGEFREQHSVCSDEYSLLHIQFSNQHR